MFWLFIIAVICTMAAVLCVEKTYELVLHGFDFKNWRCWVSILIPIIGWFGFSMLGAYCITKYSDRVADYAIDQYVMGNVEKIEVIKNGEVVDYHYKIIPTEYE